MADTFNLTERTDAQIRTWIKNHEDQGATASSLYKALLEEEARRKEGTLKIDASIEHLKRSARHGQFTTYKQLADASKASWTQVRHLMNGPYGHLDQLLGVCHARGLPLLSAICVNRDAADTGELSDDALAGFVKAAKRIGHSPTDARQFLKEKQDECFEWGRQQEASIRKS